MCSPWYIGKRGRRGNTTVTNSFPFTTGLRTEIASTRFPFPSRAGNSTTTFITTPPPPLAVALPTGVDEPEARFFPPVLPGEYRGAS